MNDDDIEKVNEKIRQAKIANRKMRYIGFRLKRLNNLVREGFSWMEAIKIRNNEERSPKHVKP